jgi:phosphoglycerate dehydrogenase-like enzyme
MKVLLVVQHRLDLWQVPAWFLDRLRQLFPALEIVHMNTYDGIESQIRNAEVLFTLSLRPEQFRHAQKLRWIHSPAAAVHQLLFPELIDSDVTLTNARDVHGPVVAEHVIAQILALAKRIPQAVRFQLRRVWGQEAMWQGPPHPREIAEATLGLIGLGAIGRAVAMHASALGMRVIALREHPEKESPRGVEKVYASSDLDKLLEQSDYVVLCPPLTPQTRGMIGAGQLARMKSDASIINVGRGPLIDEAAFLAALRNHKIGGAALDVFAEEPLPATSPLWDLENLLITPHTAGMTEKLWQRHYALFAENLRRYINQQPLLAVVNKSKGY